MAEDTRSELELLDKKYLAHLHVGSRLFHYPRKGDSETSFQKSPSAEHTLYSVVDLPTEDDVVLVRSFDEKEQKKAFSREELMTGDWWYSKDWV